MEERTNPELLHGDSAVNPQGHDEDGEDGKDQDEGRREPSKPVVVERRRHACSPGHLARGNITSKQATPVEMIHP